MEKYEIKIDDMYNGFFHFTNENNIQSIEKKGLIPNIGYNARNIEQSKKIFFVEGLDNYLILFDCWITALYYIPVIPIIYKLGAYFLRKKWFPNIIGDTWFKIFKKTRLHEKSAFKKVDDVLDNGIVLKLDLKENIDFRYDDIDEIKSRGYIKRHLIECGYSEKYSDLNSNIMDKWNMHTLTNHKIDIKKIKLCYLDDGNYKLRDIFNYCLKNTKIDIKDICPNLYEYLKYKNYKEV